LIGTAGIVQWNLQANGKLFHSGLPHKAINPIELGFLIVFLKIDTSLFISHLINHLFLSNNHLSLLSHKQNNKIS